MPHPILSPLSLSLRAGGLFHFKKDHVAYSIAAEDYNKDLHLCVTIKENRLLDEFFLYVLEDLHTSQGLGGPQINQ